MIESAPPWLHPILWIAVIALTATAIVFLWLKVSPRVEQLEVEAQAEHPNHWKRSALTSCLLLFILIVIGVIALAS